MQVRYFPIQASNGIGYKRHADSYNERPDKSNIQPRETVEGVLAPKFLGFSSMTGQITAEDQGNSEADRARRRQLALQAQTSIYQIKNPNPAAQVLLGANIDTFA